MNALLLNWAMIPEFVTNGYGQAGILTSIFLHGGIMHLLGNMLFLYIFVNVGMVTGLLPVVGAPLPLISYGGTAMLTVFLALGVVVNIALHTKLQDSDFY